MPRASRVLSGTDGSPPPLEKRTWAGTGGPAKWGARLRADAESVGVNVPAHRRPLACTARWPAWLPYVALMPATRRSEMSSVIGLAAFGDPLAGVTPLDGRMEALLLGVVLEPASFRRVPGDAVEQGGEQLGALQAHVVVGLVDHQLLHHQLIDRNTGDAISELFDAVVKLLGGHRFEHKPPLGGRAPVDGVAGEQHALGLLGTQPVHPHRGRRTTPHASGHVTDSGVV